MHQRCKMEHCGYICKYIISSMRIEWALNYTEAIISSIALLVMTHESLGTTLSQWKTNQLLDMFKTILKLLWICF